METKNTVVDFLCEKLKEATSPASVNRLCQLIKVLKYGDYIILKEDCFEKIKQLCIDGYFNTKYLIEKYSMSLNKVVGEKKRKLEEFIRDLKAIEYDREHNYD